jgi:LysM repeat protein
MKKIAWVFFLLLFIVALFGQTKYTPQDYIEMYHQIAIKKMHEYKIPASITLAQGILESGSGNSNLARNANNHFGIKCHTEWNGPTYIMDDDTKNECFRKYKHPEESFSDHSLFLTSRPRYKFLFDDYEVTDYKGWAHGLKKAGYATNPAYAERLINIIEKYDLAKYDQMKPGGKPVLAKQPKEQPASKEKESLELPKGAYISNAEKQIFIYNRIETTKGKGRKPVDLAVEYDIPLDKLMKYNDINEGDAFDYNQNVFLQPKRKKGTESTHTVQQGESMWDISQMYGIKLSSLYKKNMLDRDKEVKPGEVVSLRKKSTQQLTTFEYEEFLSLKRKLEEDQIAKKEAEEAKIKKELEAKEAKEKAEKEAAKVPTIKKEIPISHTVLPGETLYSISNKYYVTVESLVKINNLPNYNIKVGDVLLLREKPSNP